MILLVGLGFAVSLGDYSADLIVELKALTDQ